MNQKGYDTFETTVGKLSARRIQIFRGYFCLGIILEVILKKEVKMTFTKIDRTESDPPRRELSNGGLKSVVALLIRRQINFSCVSTTYLGVQSSCSFY